MDKMTKEDNSQHRERDRTLPSPVKRPRTQHIVTNEHSGKSIFDFPDLLTFQNTTKSSPSKTILQKNLIVVCTTESDDIQDDKSFLQLQDVKVIVTPKVRQASVTDDAVMLLPKVCFIAAERHLVYGGKNLVSKSDKLFSCLPDEAGKALVEAHISADMSSPSDAFCQWLGKSIEDKALGFIQNGKDWRQVQHSVTQKQAFTLACDEEIIYQSGCSRGNVVCDTGNTWSQSAGVEARNQKSDEPSFRENILFSEDAQVGDRSRSCGRYDCEFNNSCPQKDSMVNFPRDFKHEEKSSQSRISKCDDFTICDEETKPNENSMSKNSFLSVADIPVFPHDALGRKTASENVSFEIDDLYGVKGEYAAGKMKAWNEMADHTAEAPESERISQEPAEEDNNVGLYGVIDPAIWKETDRDAEERRCNSASTAGVELSPSINVCEMEMPPPLCFDVRTSQEVSAPNQIRQFYHQSITLQCKDEKEDLCQSCREPKAASITSSETYNMTGNQSSSPCSPTIPPAGDGRQESHSAVELQLKEQDLFDSFPNSLGNVRTREVEQSQAEISRIDRITMTKERKNMAHFEEIKTDPPTNVVKTAESEQEHLHQNELQKDNTAYIQLKCLEDKLEEKFELFVDHPYSAHVSDMVETTVEKKKKGVKDVEEGLKTACMYENSDAEVKSEEDVQQPQNEHKADQMEMSHVKCAAKQTDSSRLTVAGQHEKENKLSVCPDYRHRLEAYMPENTHDLVTFASPPTSDAVVPCQSESEPSPSRNANSPTTLNRTGRFSPVASACTRYNWVPEEVDIFEKIQLSPDDYGDNDAGLGNMSSMSSLPGPLFKSPQPQPPPFMQEPESNGYHQALEEEERNDKELHERMANGFDSDTSFNDPNFISVGFVGFGRPEQQPNCESTFDCFEPIQVDSNTQSKSPNGSAESDSAPADAREYPGFAMEKQFDMVLKELKLFFEISASDLGSGRESRPKQCDDISETLKTDTDSKEPVGGPDRGCHKNTSSGAEVISCKTGDNQREVPLGSHVCPETHQDTVEKHREPWEVEQRRKMWSPSFTSQQLSHSHLERPKRLEPLRTCSRPIRLGLSKRAKTKHLHRPHPYR